MTQFTPDISIDCVVFGFDLNELKVLLINRDSIHEKNINPRKFKIPGSLIMHNESLMHSAQRVLLELTGLKDIFLKQFGVFDDPHRLSEKEDVAWLSNLTNTQIQRVVTVAYYSLIKLDQSKPTSLSNEFNARWYRIDEIPELIFDHNKIVNEALATLRNEFVSQPLGFELLPEKFTLNQLQQLYEDVLNVKIDNRNFRKKVAMLKYIEPLNEKQTGVSHKPAKFYKFNREEYNHFIQNNNLFII